jgi:S1-C subfamily serine protease
MAQYLGYAGEGGVLVKETEPGSPAEKGGIKKTDIIVKIENEPVKNKRISGLF